MMAGFHQCQVNKGEHYNEGADSYQPYQTTAMGISLLF